MIHLSQALGSTQTLTVGGEDFIFSPLDLSDIGYMQDWWCELPLVRCQRELEKFANLHTEEQQAEKIAAAKAEYEDRKRVRSGLEIDPEIIDRCGRTFTVEFGSTEGLTKLVYLSLRKTRPEITEALAATIVGIEGVAAMQDFLDAMSFPAQDPNADLLYGEEEEKKTA